MSHLGRNSIAKTNSVLNEINDTMESIDNKTTQLNLASFGELQVAQITPVFALKGLNGVVNDRKFDNLVVGGGSITNNDSQFDINVSTNAGDKTFLRSLRQINYRAGQGVLMRITAVFTTPTTSLNQLAGMGNDGNGLFFGYQELDFGVIKLTNGEGATHRLEITVAENASETATITLDNIPFNVSITNSGGSLEFTSYELGRVGSFGPWQWEVIGEFIYFSKLIVGVASGTFSYSSTGASTGTFTQLTAGVEIETDFITQSNWNADKMDGTGNSGMTLDTQKGNVYQIQFQWLGYGNIRYFIQSDTTGDFVLVHQINYTNNNTEVSIRRPSFRGFAGLSSTNSTTSLTMNVGSMAGFIEGLFKTNANTLWAENSSKTISSNTETNILIIDNKLLYNGEINSGEINIKQVSLSSDGTKNVIFRFYTNPSGIGDGTTSDFPDFQEKDLNQSIAILDILSTSIQGGDLIYAITIGKADSQQVILPSIILERTKLMVITAESTGASTIDVGLNWEEDL